MPTSFPRFTSHGLTHVGLVRRRNEDAFLDRPEIGLWVVADGMGGHQDGDYASARVVGRLADFKPFADLEEYTDEVRRALAHVDVHLRARAKAIGPGTVIASTAACLLVYGEEFAAVWAGDSRIYQWRGGELRQLSTDHSRVQELIDAGQLAPEEAAGHPEAHVVTRAIGAGLLHFGQRVGVVRPGERFLLCTDGLTNAVAEADIVRTLGEAVEPSAAAARLVDLALAGGGGDNVTVIVVAVEPGD
ncbi:MAG TPA: protein phosphatase 2C domain-containing protein [Stellaceae bacterium]|nr:protein phosphatase 2C domain-containing protein [Stellaceae bacterium]